MTNKEFSLLRFIREKQSPENDWINSLELQSRDPNFITQPMPMRVLSSGTATAGGHTVASKIEGDETQNFFANSGLLSKVTILDGLKENLSLTRKTGKSTVSTTDETSSATESTALAGENVSLKPVFLRAWVGVSKTLLRQTSRSADMLVMNDLRDALTSELERQILVGRGETHDEISGLSGNTNLNSVSGLTNTDIFASEKRLGVNHVPLDYYWLGNSAMRETLRNQYRSTNGTPILTDNNTMIGYDFLHSEHMPASNLYLLNPQFLTLAIWGSQVEIFVDNKTLSHKNQSRIIASLEANATMIHQDAIEILTS